MKIAYIILVVTFLIVAKNWKQSECSSQHIYTMDYFVAIEKKCISTTVGTWKDFLEVLVSEKSKMLMMLHNIQILKYKYDPHTVIYAFCKYL